MLYQPIEQTEKSAGKGSKCQVSETGSYTSRLSKLSNRLEREASARFQRLEVIPAI